MKCPYNPNHVKFVEEMELHLEICPDMLIFGTRTGSELIFMSLSNSFNNYLDFSVDEEIGQNVKYKIEHRDVQGEEDWEDADENPETYNPLLKLEATRL